MDRRALKDSESGWFLPLEQLYLFLRLAEGRDGRRVPPCAAFASRRSPKAHSSPCTGGSVDAVLGARGAAGAAACGAVGAACGGGAGKVRLSGA